MRVPSPPLYVDTSIPLGSIAAARSAAGSRPCRPAKVLIRKSEDLAPWKLRAGL